MPQNEHAQQLEQKRMLRLREILSELPPYVRDFFRALQPQTSALTRLAYAHDIRIFYAFLSQRVFPDVALSDISLEMLAQLPPREFEVFLEELSLYERGFEIPDDDETAPELLKNGLPGKQRKLSTLRSFFKYYYRQERLPENQVEKVDLPRLPEKPIVRLEIDEVVRLLDLVDRGDALTPHQQVYHKKTRLRDAAMLTLLLSTGIRVSECVGIDRQHVDFDTESFRITRKGGDDVILYLPRETVEALRVYMAERNMIEASPGHEEALFLSLQRKRIDVRSVENLVHKYAQHIAPLKPISPHKLRSTFGTQLYQETGDIYLVADVLGHSDVNTTRRHYAAMADDRRRHAAKVTRLRDDAAVDAEASETATEPSREASEPSDTAE